MNKLLSIPVLVLLACSAAVLVLGAQQRQMREPGLQDTLLLKDYKPQSIFNTPRTDVLKAKYPAIDMHMHAPRPNTDLQAAAGEILKNMDATNVQKTILFAGTGKGFDQLAAVFGKHPERFELWCGLDFSNFPASTLAGLESCVKAGGKGLGEISDKGTGYRGVEPMHLDDPRMDPILEKVADLGLPMNVHMGDPQWMYEPMDASNDLLFEALYWRRDNKNDDKDLAGMLQVLENAVRKHPRVNFIACHFANQTFDLDRLGKLFDKYPNLYADTSQRESYVGAIPRFGKQFMEKYADRMVFGTDQGHSLPMYRHAFRVFETLDEHFYAWDVANTRFALSGLGLSDATLKKLYQDNALKLLKK